MSDRDALRPRSMTRRTVLQGLALAGSGLATTSCGRPGTDTVGAVDTARAAPEPQDPAFELHYEVYGEGPPVVFAPRFSREFRCVTYSQRGFGLSPDQSGGPGRAAFVDDLRSLLDRLDIEKASLVGQSMGGRSVLGFAAAYPERVDALVLSGTTGGYRDAELDSVRAAAPDLGPRSAFAAASVRFRTAVRAAGRRPRSPNPFRAELLGEKAATLRDLARGLHSLPGWSHHRAAPGI